MPAGIIHNLKLHWGLIIWAALLTIVGILTGFFTYHQFPEYNWLLFFVPAAILLMLFLSIRSFHTLFWIAVVCTPFSLAVLDAQANVGLSLPNEPVIVLLMAVLLLKLIFTRSIDRAILVHPVSVGIYIYLAWLLITSCTSTLPLVSFKFLFSRLWFIVVFYFYGITVFREKKNITRFIWFYSIPLSITVINTLIQHQAAGFSRDAAFYVMSPFFIDHGVYAATIAFMIPPVLLLLLSGKKTGQSSGLRLLAFLLTLLFLIGILLSYTRAAWLSLAAVLVMLAIFSLRIRMWVLITTFCLLGIGYLSFQEEITIALSGNKQTSSTGVGLNKQVQSITNISTDYSNLERINRWNSAIGMWKDKPVTGYGPGTYIFKYAPFQHSSDLTPISTNFGDGGNSHSEYLNPLAETGLPGMITVLLLVFLFIRTGMKLVYESPKKHVRWLAGGVVLGLVTYYTHGILNNYSDSDKTMVLIWAFVAMLVSLDVYGQKKRIGVVREDRNRG